jgi:hypothetical protein
LDKNQHSHKPRKNISTMELHSQFTSNTGTASQKHYQHILIHLLHAIRHPSTKKTAQTDSGVY